MTSIDNSNSESLRSKRMRKQNPGHPYVATVFANVFHLLLTVHSFQLDTMLARGTLARATAARSVAQGASAAANSTRNMATLRELELRLKSVRNIEKITKVCVEIYRWLIGAEIDLTTSSR